MCDGERRGLIILVSFQDQDFGSANPKETWTAIANEQGYTGNGAVGSVSDYFRDQSYDQFHLTFDVVGPVKVAHEHAYYGTNKDWGDPTGWFDQNVGEFVEEACKAVADTVCFADYDWDDDGLVEEVYLVYAGHGENDYSDRDSTVIWPHMASLSGDWEGYENGLYLQGVCIDVYACSNEIDRGGALAGMGTICHEFSHCLGLPDLYNTDTGNSVLGHYDLMDLGSYNGPNNNGWCPPGYSSYERYACGWLTPQETYAVPEDVDLQPLHLSAEARLYRTASDANDYYLIENRQKVSWDSYLPSDGVMVWHIDYDEEAWWTNVVNNDPAHQRVERLSLAQIPTAIASLMVDVPGSLVYYDLHGRRLPSAPVGSGLYIVRFPDGTIKKCTR